MLAVTRVMSFFFLFQGVMLRWFIISDILCYFTTLFRCHLHNIWIWRQRIKVLHHHHEEASKASAKKLCQKQKKKSKQASVTCQKVYKASLQMKNLSQIFFLLVNSQIPSLYWFAFDKNISQDTDRKSSFKEIFF